LIILNVNYLFYTIINYKAPSPPVSPPSLVSEPPACGSAAAGAAGAVPPCGI